MTKFRTKFTLLDIKPPTRLRRMRTEENIAALSASVRCEAFQNTAGARIEAERPTATQNFW